MFKLCPPTRLWVKTKKPDEVCVSDFSQIDGDVEDFADTLAKCRMMYASAAEPDVQSSSVGNPFSPVFTKLFFVTTTLSQFVFLLSYSMDSYGCHHRDCDFGLHRLRPLPSFEAKNPQTPAGNHGNGVPTGRRH